MDMPRQNTLSLFPTVDASEPNQVISEDFFHVITKKSEMYSVGDFDLKFDAKQALGRKKNS